MIAIQKYHDFEPIKHHWEVLLKGNSNASFYQSVAYIEVLWKHILPYKLILRQTPEFYLFTENDKPIMILPLFRKWFKRGYTLFGYKAGCGYLDAVYDDNMTLEKMRACFSLFAAENQVDVFPFCHICDNSLLYQFLLQDSQTQEQTPRVVIDLPESFEEYTASLSKNARQNLRTAYNRLRKDEHKYEMRIFSPQEMDKHLRNALLRIYADRQIRHYKKAWGIFYRLFIRYIDIGTVVHSEMSSCVKSFVLFIDGNVAGYFDAFCTENSVVIPRLAIDDTYARYSPGMVLLNESISHFCEGKKIRTVDLTHGHEPYKLSMGGTKKDCLKGTLLLEKGVR